MDKRLVDKKRQIEGKIFKTKRHGSCQVVKYENTYNVLVKFYNPECIIKCEFNNLKKGEVKNPLQPSFYNKGYIGIGAYSAKDKRVYTLWNSLLTRAYSEKYHSVQPTYKDVSVCEEWLNFQNFAKWCYSKPFFDMKDEKGKVYQLDKDILIRGNKTYSPNTCCFIPSCINSLFTKGNAVRGKLPIGVYQLKGSKTFRVMLSESSNKKYLGTFDTPEKAFAVYKDTKERHIKEVAEKWKGVIDEKVYNKLIEYKVNIDG